MSNAIKFSKLSKNSNFKGSGMGQHFSEKVSETVTHKIFETNSNFYAK